MFNIGVFKQQQQQFSDLLPWAALVAPGVILNKDGSFQRSCQFINHDLEASEDEEIAAHMLRLNNALKNIDSGWTLYIEAKRDNITLSLPEKIIGNPLALLIDLEHHQRFHQAENNFQSYYYLTLQYLPPTETQKSLWRNFVQQAKNFENKKDDDLEQFIKESQSIFNLLQEVFLKLHWLTDEETLTYLHNIVSHKKHPVTVPQTPIYLDALLADTPLIAGLTPQLGESFLKTITIIGFPANSLPLMLERLNYLSFSYRWVTRYIALDKLSAEQQLKRHRQRWFAKRKNIFNLLHEVFSKQESPLLDQSAIDNAKEADEALLMLGNENVAFGYFTCTITLQHTDQQQLLQQIYEVEKTINGLGITTINESINAVEAWLSSIPGHCYANIRKPLLHTMNLAHLLPFSSPWPGQENDRHLNASALFYAYTYGNTPFKFSLHLGDVGHLMIIGPTGAGKSVLLNFIAWQFGRYNKAKVIIFDKGMSCLASTLGAKGKFYALGKHGDLHFQPLAHIDDEEEMAWALDWLQELLLNENITITPDLKEEIWLALKGLAHLPVEQRTLSGLVALLQNISLRQALLSYTLAGAFGQLLDAEEDNLQHHNWLCFEMEQLMNTPALIAPVLSYLFHRLEQKFSGEPTLIILDEAWLFLNHPFFADKIRDWLKSLRKKNVSVIFATQSVADAAHHAIAPTLLESCPSRIFLPNDRALEPQIAAHYSQIGLNKKQLELLSTAKNKKHYYYQSRLGTRLFSLELGELALAFCGASSQEDLHKLKTLSSLEYIDFIKEYLYYKKIPWAIEILSEN